jgi:hypothetical protein
MTRIYLLKMPARAGYLVLALGGFAWGVDTGLSIGYTSRCAAQKVAEEIDKERSAEKLVLNVFTLLDDITKRKPAKGKHSWRV